METAYEPTLQEMKDVWKRSALRRDGHTFEDDIKVPVIKQCLRNAVICLHKKNQLPQQAALSLE